jgi:hypothetical protein
MEKVILNVYNVLVRFRSIIDYCSQIRRLHLKKDINLVGKKSNKVH